MVVPAPSGGRPARADVMSAMAGRSRDGARETLGLDPTALAEAFQQLAVALGPRPQPLPPLPPAQQEPEEEPEEEQDRL